MAKVWVVCQYQESENYEGEPVHVFDKEEDAIRCARLFNKLWGSTDSVDFSPEWDFHGFIGNCDWYHYYTVQGHELMTSYEEFAKKYGYDED